jgi:tetratricopeptide (TPR) repeat protein
MKSILAVLILFTYVSVYAQEPANLEELISKGTEAYKANDFPTAYSNFTEALAIKEAKGEVDTVLYYNTGYCAYKSNKFENAPKYLNRSIELGYKEELSYVMVANSYKKLKNDELFEKMIEEAFSNYPKNKNLITLMAGYQFKEGLSFYNKASEIVANAEKVRESNATQFGSLMEQAKAAYNQALPYLLKTHELKPDTKNLPEALSGVYDALGNAAEAEKWKQQAATK